MMIVEYIQSALLLIAAFLVIVSAVGFISLSKDMKNVVYGRIHIVGIFDIACVIAMIGLGQYLLAGIYFILAPFTAHAIANAYWKKEDRENNADLMTVEETQMLCDKMMEKIKTVLELVKKATTED